VRPELARDCGLDPACRVLCGIHDSNASFLQHRAARPEASFTAISSGTWTVLLSSGVALGRIDGARDMLANVDAFGVPVATARFMGGREYAAIAGEDAKLPTEAGLRAVLHRNAMALPSFAPGGPFTAHHGRMLRCDMLDADGRAALATLYTALVTDHVLDLLGATGEVIIDGPLAGNALYAAVLAALRPADEVRVGAARAGIVGAAGFLATGTPPVAKLVPAARLPITGLAAYRVAWRALIDGGT
jgi:sugar (pentulose or hexulose) kinase